VEPVSAFAPISFLADADDVYAYCRVMAESEDLELPPYVREFFNRAIPEVAELARRAVELEEQGSALTRELDLKARAETSDDARDLLAAHDWDELIFGGFICLTCTPDDCDDPDDNVAWPCPPLRTAGVTLLHAEALIRLRRAEVELKASRARIAELESRPVSAPPAVPGSRDFYQRPQDILGHNAIARPQLADDLPTAQAHLAGDHRLCTPDWCTSVIPLRVEQIDDEIGRRSAEAGIADETGGVS